jgi:hypothetical protein
MILLKAFSADESISLAFFSLVLPKDTALSSALASANSLLATSTS